MAERYAPKSQAWRIIHDLDSAVNKIEHIWEPQGLSKEELVFWTKIRNTLDVITTQIIRTYKKQ
jgi:hypothetical protein